MAKKRAAKQSTVRVGDRFQDNDARLGHPGGQARTGRVVALLEFGARAVVLWSSGRRTRVKTSALLSSRFTRMAKSDVE